MMHVRSILSLDTKYSTPAVGVLMIDLPLCSAQELGFWNFQETCTWTVMEISLSTLKWEIITVLDKVFN